MTWQQLHRLPVLTESGQKLGQLEGVSLDSDTHGVVHYHVKPSRAILGLFSKELLVSPVLVVGMTAEAMVVKDTVTAIDAAAPNEKTRLAFGASAAKGVEMSETE